MLAEDVRHRAGANTARQESGNTLRDNRTWQTARSSLTGRQAALDLGLRATSDGYETDASQSEGFCEPSQVNRSRSIQRYVRGVSE